MDYSLSTRNLIVMAFFGLLLAILGTLGGCKVSQPVIDAPIVDAAPDASLDAESVCASPDVGPIFSATP